MYFCKFKQFRSLIVKIKILPFCFLLIASGFLYAQMPDSTVFPVNTGEEAIKNYIYKEPQPVNKDSSLAARYFDEENYAKALELYLQMLEKDKDNTHLNYMVGRCYLLLNSDKTRSTPYFETVYAKGGYPDDLLLYMGKAYMYAYNFEDALTFFNNYRTIIHSKKLELLEGYYEDVMDGKIDYQHKITAGNFGVVDRCIENCENALELLKTPVNVSFENAGVAINTKYADYNPFVSGEEGKLYFTSNRPDSLDSVLQALTSDVYFSYVKDGEWTKASKLGNTINTPENEECVFLSNDGKRMMLYQDNERASGDLFLVDTESESAMPQAFEQPINTISREFQGWISTDESFMFFSSDRKGGLGDADIYMIKKLPNGKWSLPLNLGSNINTSYNEAFPVFDEKKKVLYFSSEGHTNMGGYDVFSALWDEETQQFQRAVNMGYPINTPENDMQFSLTDNGRVGYLSAVRKEGLGDLDIYRITFNAIEKRPSVIRGGVSIKEADTLRKEIIATIAIKDVLLNKELDSKKVNPRTGRYIFSVENPGKYLLTVKSPGFKNLEQEMNLYDKSDYVFEIENDFLLEKNISAAEEASINKADSTEVYSFPKLPVNSIIWGVVKTDIPIEADINASIVLKDAATGQDVYKKNVNPKSGKYTFSVNPGKYIFTVNSPGYEAYSEIIYTDSISTFIATGKNVTLKRAFINDEERQKAIEKNAAIDLQKAVENSPSSITNGADSVKTTAPLQNPQNHEPKTEQAQPEKRTHRFD